MGPLFFFFFLLAVFLWVVCIFRLQTPGADAVVLQVSCWSLGVIPEVSHLKFRGPSKRCCVWHLALLAPSSADSKNMALGLLFGNLGGVQFCFICFIFHKKWEGARLRALCLVFKPPTVCNWAAVGAPHKT